MHRLRRDHKESGSDTDEEEDGELLGKGKGKGKGKEGGSSAVVVEMQQLQDLLERTAGAAMGKPEAATGAQRKKFYGGAGDEQEDEDGAPDDSLAQAIGAGLSTVMAKVGKGGAVNGSAGPGGSKKQKAKAKLDRDVQLPTMAPADTNKLVAHYLGQGPASPSKPSSSNSFTLDD